MKRILFFPLSLSLFSSLPSSLNTTLDVYLHRVSIISADPRYDHVNRNIDLTRSRTAACRSLCALHIYLHAPQRANKPAGDAFNLLLKKYLLFLVGSRTPHVFAVCGSCTVGLRARCYTRRCIVCTCVYECGCVANGGTENERTGEMK